MPAEADTPRTTTSHDGLTTLAERVNSVEVSMSMDAVLETHHALDFMQDRIREMRKSLDARLIEWIEANGAITFGTKRLYVGSKKETKVIDLRQAVEALLAECGGDFDTFCGCLASGALKHGACKAVMKPESYEQHFETVTKTELREGVEAPVKQLKEVDEAFLPRKTKR